MPLTNKLEVIADAIREKLGTLDEMTLNQMAAAIKTITTETEPGTTYEPAETEYSITDSFTALGNAIRFKTGGSERLTLDEMPDAIRSILSPEDYFVFTYNSVYSYYTISGVIEAGKSRTTLTIPSHYQGKPVKRIGERAFYGCSNLTNVTIPDTITYIGLYAFYGCSSSMNIYITSLENWCGITHDGGAFSGSYNLYLNGTLVTNVVMPAIEVSYANPPLTYIEVLPYVFEDCSSIRSVTIPNSIQRIHYHAFNGCSNLTRVTIGNGVSSINEDVFKFCPALTNIYVAWSQGAVANAPWGAENATIHYNSGGEQ